MRTAHCCAAATAALLLGVATPASATMHEPAPPGATLEGQWPRQHPWGFPPPARPVRPAADPATGRIRGDDRSRGRQHPRIPGPGHGRRGHRGGVSRNDHRRHHPRLGRGEPGRAQHGWAVLRDLPRRRQDRDFRRPRLGPGHRPGPPRARGVRGGRAAAGLVLPLRSHRGDGDLGIRPRARSGVPDGGLGRDHREHHRVRPRSVRAARPGCRGATTAHELTGGGVVPQDLLLPFGAGHRRRGQSITWECSVATVRRRLRCGPRAGNGADCPGRSSPWLPRAGRGPRRSRRAPSLGPRPGHLGSSPVSCRTRGLPVLPTGR